MKTGFCGTFVISWSQTEIDGFPASDIAALDVGSVWVWRGQVTRVDGPNDVLRLDRADDAENLRKRAARMVRRLVGAALERETERTSENTPDQEPLRDGSFVVTDGAQVYTVTLIETGTAGRPLLMFLNEIPPQGKELWVVQHALEQRAGQSDTRGTGGVICFTPDTRIRTPDGAVKIQDLSEGDAVQTKDNGVQRIEWIGSRRMSGARLFAMPELRPIRFDAGSLGGSPDEELLVSPQHRVLIKGCAARDLFNTDEVLVAASDLVNDGSIRVDHAVREVTYIHMLFDRHQVVWANGVETESFHPASAALSALDADDRVRLLSYLPELHEDPHLYGAFARRSLSAPEAAILRHAA